MIGDYMLPSGALLQQTGSLMQTGSILPTGSVLPSSIVHGNLAGGAAAANVLHYKAAGEI